MKIEAFREMCLIKRTGYTLEQYTPWCHLLLCENDRGLWWPTTTSQLNPQLHGCNLHLPNKLYQYLETTIALLNRVDHQDFRTIDCATPKKPCKVSLSWRMVQSAAKGWSRLFFSNYPTLPGSTAGMPQRQIFQALSETFRFSPLHFTNLWYWVQFLGATREFQTFRSTEFEDWWLLRKKE